MGTNDEIERLRRALEWIYNLSDKPGPIRLIAARNTINAIHAEAKAALEYDSAHETRETAAGERSYSWGEPRDD